MSSASLEKEAKQSKVEKQKQDDVKKGQGETPIDRNKLEENYKVLNEEMQEIKGNLKNLKQNQAKHLESINELNELINDKRQGQDPKDDDSEEVQQAKLDIENLEAEIENMNEETQRLEAQESANETEIKKLQAQLKQFEGQKKPDELKREDAKSIQRDEVIWKAYDFLFPGGRVAKLIKVSDVHAKVLPFNDMLFKIKMMDGAPVVNLIGAKDTNRGKFYGGIARACFNTDAVVVDNGISTGIEKFVLRRGVKLIGVAPENEIKYPKMNPTFVDPYEISNGHTHLFLLNNKEKNLFWGNESFFKVNLCKKIAEGRLQKSGQRESFKIINILLGESDSFMSELQLAVLHNQPILVVKGSQICNEFFANQAKSNPVYSEPSFGPLVKKGHFYGINSLDSEDIAQFVHFFLTVTPY